MNRKNRNRQLSRRNVLKTGAVASALGLSGCLGGNGDDEPSDSDSDPGDSDPSTPMDDDSDAQDPPDRVQPYLDQLPDYYPDSYWEIIDGAMDEGTITYYTAYFGDFANAYVAAFQEDWDFVDVDVVTLPTARVLQRFQIEASRDEWIPDILFTYDAVANNQMHSQGLANSDYESPEKQMFNEEHYHDEFNSLFGANYSFNVPTWNPGIISQNYSEDEIPLTAEDLATTIDANPDLWDENYAMYDAIMSTSMWQQLYQLTKVHGEDETWQLFETMGQARPDAFWSASTMGGWVGEGDVQYGYGLAHWIVEAFILPEYSEDELTWGNRLNPTTHLGPHVMSAQPNNPNRARLMFDWGLSRNAIPFLVDEWNMVSRRTDIEPGDVKEDPIWGVSMTETEIRENVPAYDEFWLPYQEMTGLLQERDAMREQWYQIFS